MKEKSYKAIKTYLQKKGYELHPDATDSVMVAYDTDAEQLAFIRWGYRCEPPFPKEEDWDRSVAENLGLTYLCEHPEVAPAPIRYDDLMLVAATDNRAMIRHHKSVML